MTLDEFRDAEEEPGYHYELARGSLEVTEVPSDSHWQVADNLHEAISTYRRRHPGTILRIGRGSDCRVWVAGMTSGRNPDVAVVFPETPKDSRGRRPPRLVAEVVSEGGEARDYQEKRDEYLVFGILEYWIVDSLARAVAVLARREVDGSATWTEQVFRGADVIVSGLLPNFTGTVAELWANVDQDENETD
jgi:Uma2 family endonuclease